METGESMLYKYGLATPIKHQLYPVKYSYLWQRAMVFSGLCSWKTAICVTRKYGLGNSYIYSKCGYFLKHVKVWSLQAFLPRYLSTYSSICL